MKYFCVLLFACVCCQSLASEPVAFPVKYPEKVKNMTDAEFFQWATARNQQATKLWEREAATLPPRWLTTPVVITQRYSNFRTSSRSLNDTSYSVRYTRPHRYLNPDYTSPGPLTIVNPYCNPTKAKK